MQAKKEQKIANGTIHVQRGRIVGTCARCAEPVQNDKEEGQSTSVP